MPGDRKCDGRVEKNAVVICVVRVLPVVVRVDQQVPAERLLKAGVELIALPWFDRNGISAEDVQVQAALPGYTGEQQILVEGCFQSPRICRPQDGSGLLDVVSDTKP